MDLNAEVLTILIVLLPGFACAKIVQWLCVRPEQSEMDKIVEALLYSFAIYAITFAIFGSVQQVNRKHIGVLAITSAVLAVILSLAWNKDVFGPFLRRIGATHRTSRPSVWHDVFHYYGGYVLVELDDGKLLLGWVRYYADKDDEPSLFLEDAAWVAPDGKRVQIDGPGILLTRHSGIRSVGFHTATDNSGKSQTAKAGQSS